MEEVNTELEATKAAAVAFESLQPEARQRLLKWLGDRYVDTSWLAIRDAEREAKNAADEAQDAFLAFFKKLQQAAKELDMAPIDVMRAAHEFVQHRDRTKAEAEAESEAA